ncbi:MAG: hypothetical protein J5762_05410 [Clostridia bacterium]|nr:hypothetical protein [Clostridia bacterium]
MKDELNNYNIVNADGVSKEHSGDEKISFDNDDPGFIREDALSGQSEVYRAPETFDERREDKIAKRDRKEKREEKRTSSSSSSSSSSSDIGGNESGSAASDVSSSVSSSATAGTTSVASALGGTMGALASVVATTVVAALVIAIAFVSTMTINAKLAISEMTSFVFQVEITNAEDEDFLKPITATLDGDGYHSEQEVHKDTVYMTFDGLESGKEYLLKIYNEEKTFFKKSYVTATEYVEKGSMDVVIDNGEAIVTVENVLLSAGEYYTITVKDADGNVVFIKDSVEQNAQFRFSLEKPTALYYSISVNGAVYAVAETAIEPVYDLENGVWHWNTENDSAYISFVDKNGGAPLVFDATIRSEVIIEASCESDGSRMVTATVSYEGKDYSDRKTVVLTSPGHAYGDLIAEVPAGCETTGTAVHYHCEECDKYFDADKNEVTEEALVIAAKGHAYGDLIAEVPAGCETEGFAAHYRCEACNKYFNADKNEATEEALVIAAKGHTYGELIEEVPAGCETTGTAAHYHCEECNKYFDADKNEATEEALVIAAKGHTYGDLIAEVPAGCETTGTAAHYHCEECDKYFDADKNEATEEALVIAAKGHAYGEWMVEVPATSSSDGMAGHYYCSVCHKYFDADKNEVDGDSLVIPAYDVSYDYDDPVWSWGRDEATGALDGTATVTFIETHGEDPLVITAFVVKNERTPATCESPAVKYYLADTSEYPEISYMSETSEDFEEGDPLGHAYGDLIAEVPAGCETTGTAAHYECSVCHKVFDENKVETTPEALAVSALGHAYGDLIAEVSAGCETTGTAAHYECSVCHKVFDENKVETTPEALAVSALGHTYGDLIAEVSAGCENDGVAAHYHCEECDKYFDADKNETTLGALTIPATGVAGEPVKLIKDDVSADIVGKKVYIMLGLP